MQNQFRLSVLVLSLMAVSGSGQVMAADATTTTGGGTVTSNGTAIGNGNDIGSTNVVNTSADSLNTGGVGATTVGNATGATSINGGTSASISASGAGAGSYTVLQTALTVGTTAPVLVNGNATSQAVVNGTTYVNRINGNTLIDGNLNINGSLNYSSNASATTTVSGTNTTGSMSVVNAGQTGAVVDGNGKITTGTTAQATAALTVTNTLGNTHGIVVQETQTTISGGNRSTSLTLNDNGARFSNSQNGEAVTVTGVADGQQAFDAVNYRQLRSVAAGVAGVSAMANIPLVDQNKTFAVGVGLGGFQGQASVALGGSYRFAQNAVLKASVATTNAESKSTVYGIGAGFSW